MYYYAQLNSDGLVVALSQTSEIIECPNMIPLSDEEWKSAKLLSCYIDDEWIDPQPEEQIPMPQDNLVTKIDEMQTKIDKLTLLIESLAK